MRAASLQYIYLYIYIYRQFNLLLVHLTFSSSQSHNKIPLQNVLTLRALNEYSDTYL